MSSIFLFARKIKPSKHYRNDFILPKKLLLSFVLEIFKLVYFPLPLFFPFSVIADFIEEVDHHAPKLDFKNKDFSVSGELNFGSCYLAMEKFGCAKANFDPLYWQGDSLANSMLITALYLI